MSTETTDPPDLQVGMITGMTESGPKAKIAISLREDLVARIRARVERGDAESVSGYIQHAIEDQMRAEVEFDEMIAESLEESGGPPTDEELAWAARVFEVEP